MISGSSQADAIQKQKDINTKEFFRIITYTEFFTEEDIARLFHLIQEGININARDSQGRTPLYSCIVRKVFQVAKKLVELGADVNIECNRYPSSSDLHKLVNFGNVEMIALLVKAGKNINVQADDGTAPLHYATLLHKAEIAQLLLSLGAERDIKDSLGNTPLHMAIMLDTGIAKLLLNEGASVNAQNSAGDTPLKSAFKVFLNMPAPINETVVTWLKNRFSVFINKLVEDDCGRFDMLCAELGEDFASVKTVDDMVAKIVILDPAQIERIIGMIEVMYLSTAKIAPASLDSRLYDALDHPPTPVHASSSSACIDDEQPPLIWIAPVKKGHERVKSSRDDNEASTTISRPRCSFFCR